MFSLCVKPYIIEWQSFVVIVSRIRIQDKNVSSLTPGDLLRVYCLSAQMSEPETEILTGLAEKIFRETAIHED